MTGWGRNIYNKLTLAHHAKLNPVIFNRSVHF